jgi:hypothetical protein
MRLLSGSEAVQALGAVPSMASANADRCALADVPILRMILRPCDPGFTGFRCDIRWDVGDSFLPAPRRWARQWNASVQASVDCQAAFFAAFEEVLTRAHWEQEWDAQPFRIAATPPRTMGKMLHQLVTANYYHLTMGTKARPPIRKGVQAPGSYMRALPNPGFRWNILDYGGGMREQVDYKRLVTMPGNVFSRPLSGSSRCATNPGAARGAWHCLWQRFPTQFLAGHAPARGTPVAAAAERLYNLSLAGSKQTDMLQYLAVAGVTRVFTQPTHAVHAFIADHLKVICHRPGPYCSGTGEGKKGLAGDADADAGTASSAQRTPIAAIHVRHGDSCDGRMATTAGPFNAMFVTNPTTGKLERGSRRLCYDWKVYRRALQSLQRLYGARTVIVVTDDHSGSLLRGLQHDTDFNWVYLDYPRTQFKKGAWMEFRSDLDENAPFSLAAELELVSAAHLFVGNMGSHTSRMMYMRMIPSTRTAVLPPFVSVDGYGMCCGFTDECTRPQIRKRSRSIRQCIYTYGLATGGEQYFYH